MANQVIYGIVSSRAQAEKIIQDLVDAGLNSNDVSFLSAQGVEFKEFPTDANQMESNQRNWRNEDRFTSQNMNKNMSKQSNMGMEKHSKAPEGAASGAAAGGIIGGVLGLLAGIGALAIPGAGPFIAAGPLLAALSGMGVGGLTGGILGALVGLGIPEFEAKRYENSLKKGGVLLAVKTNSDAFVKKAKEIMQRDGAQDITTSSVATSSKEY
jgi:hypothetical protein